MTRDDVLEAIREYAALLRRDAKRCLRLEQEVRAYPSVGQKLEGLEPELSQRQRDYAILIRSTQVMRRRFLAGKDWLSSRIEMKKFEALFRPRVARLDGLLMQLRREANSV